MKMSKPRIRRRFAPGAAAALLILPLFTLSPAQQARTSDVDLVRLLSIEPGMTVADVGAGGGGLSFLLSERVGPDGRVYANEISENLVEKIEKKIREKGLANITTLLGKEDDPLLPEKADIIILNFVYHHLSKPAEFMARTLSYLKDGGRLVITAEDILIYRQLNPKSKRADKDPCLSDPAETQAAVEKAGFVFKKREYLAVNPKVYVLTFEARPQDGERQKR